MARDERPPVWVGHIAIKSPVVTETRDFMVQIGMRPIAEGDGFAVLELRGGTHLVVLHADEPQSGPAGFDLMVDDLKATHAHFQELGLEPSEIREGRIHHSFDLASPSGHTITFNSTHVSSLPV